MSDTTNTQVPATTPDTNGDTSGKLPNCCSGAPPDPDPGPIKG